MSSSWRTDLRLFDCPTSGRNLSTIDPSDSAYEKAFGRRQVPQPPSGSLCSARHVRQHRRWEAQRL